jgi:multidrug efflux pump subunit AcrA (membrane-fusion protein)
MAKLLIGLSVLFMTLSAVFGVLNTSKARTLRDVAEKSSQERAQVERARAAKDAEITKREAAAAAAVAKSADIESKVAAAEGDLIKTQQDRAQLQAQLQQKQTEIDELKVHLADAGPKELMPDALPMPGAGDLQTQLEETRRQLDSAEREKQLLAAKIRSTDRGLEAGPQPRPRAAAPRNPGLRGTVLAVNQAYNFVVLNLGNRQGVEPNSEMVVLRGGSMIGRIRISSVEPATAIGDIISSSLPRGVQVQPGDIVIYAGSSL